MSRHTKSRKALQSDSVPMHFSAADLRNVHHYDRDRWLDNHHPLDFLSVDKVRSSMNAAARGAHAEIQWLWEKLEPADAILATCVERRAAALKKLPWSIRPKDGLSDIERTLAEAQCRTLQDFANSITNLDASIRALAQASMRGYRHLQLLATDSGLEIIATDNWNWCQRGYQGEWRWNPTANFGTSEGEALPVDAASIISRFCPRPIDQPATMLCLDRRNAKAQWMVFNGRYGTPAMFCIMPQGVDRNLRDAYLDMARQTVSNAAGVLPHGADIKIASASSTGPDTFRGIIDMSNAEMVLRATGGLMTMLTAPGEGTTSSTGNTHQDAFDELAAAEGQEIAAILHRGVFAPCLEQWHPGQPELVEFVIERAASREASDAVQHITSLKSAGYETSIEQVAEMTGYETEIKELPAIGGMQAYNAARPQRATNYRLRYAPSCLWPAARQTFERAINGLAPDKKDDALTPDELAALSAMAGMKLQPDQLRAAAEGIETELRASIEPYTPKVSAEEEEKASNSKSPCQAKSPANCRHHGNGGLPRSGERSKKTKSKARSNTPLKAGENAKTQAKVNAISAAIKRAAKGKNIYGVAKRGKTNINIKSGDPGHNGAKHQQKHNKDNDSNNRTTAKSIMLGKAEKDRNALRVKRKDRRAILNRGKGNESELVTAYRRND